MALTCRVRYVMGVRSRLCKASICSVSSFPSMPSSSNPRSLPESLWLSLPCPTSVRFCHTFFLPVFAGIGSLQCAQTQQPAIVCSVQRFLVRGWVCIVPCVRGSSSSNSEWGGRWHRSRAYESSFRQEGEEGAFCVNPCATRQAQTSRATVGAGSVSRAENVRNSISLRKMHSYRIYSLHATCNLMVGIISKRNFKK